MDKNKIFSNINLLLLKTNYHYQPKHHINLFYIFELLSINNKYSYYYFSNYNFYTLVNLGFIKQYDTDVYEITKLGKLYLKLIFGQKLNKIQNLMNNSFENSSRYFNDIIKYNDYKKLILIIKNICPALKKMDLSFIKNSLIYFNVMINSNSYVMIPSAFNLFVQYINSKVDKVLISNINNYNLNNHYDVNKYILVDDALSDINTNLDYYYFKFCTKSKLIDINDKLCNNVLVYKSHDTEFDLFNFLINSNSYPKFIFKNPIGFKIALHKAFD